MSTIINTFISPSVTNTYANDGNIVTNISGVTGNFVNVTFYFDQYTLETGTNLIEGFITRDFTMTGYGIGAINSGVAGSVLSGKMYQRTTENQKVNFLDFSLGLGRNFYSSGGFNQTITGLNRVGLDLISVPTGMTGLSVGVFGVGY